MTGATTLRSASTTPCSIGSGMILLMNSAWVERWQVEGGGQRGGAARVGSKVVPCWPGAVEIYGAMDMQRPATECPSLQPSWRPPAHSTARPLLNPPLRTAPPGAAPPRCRPPTPCPAPPPPPAWQRQGECCFTAAVLADTALSEQRQCTSMSVWGQSALLQFEPPLPRCCRHSQLHTPLAGQDRPSLLRWGGGQCPASTPPPQLSPVPAVPG